MTTILNQSYTLMTREKANDLARMLNLDEEEVGMEYRAMHDPTGRGLSFVEYYADGEMIGRL